MRSLNRRQFVASAAALAAASRYAHARQEPSASPNEAVVLGFIGVGGMGTGLLNIFKDFPDVRVATVCDVYETHALRAREAAGGAPKVESDFRRVLDRKDIDAVVIATPDHWHAIPTILACQAGKDVYCEKPLAYTIGEGHRMVDAAAKANRVTQMGNLIHATENYHRMVEIVQSGVLGRIVKVRIWMTPPQTSLGNPPDTAPPEGCDYDTWLGPAPSRPFNPNRFTFNWRWFWDYGGGYLTDFVCHLLDPVHWALGLTAPIEITAAGGRYQLDDNTETPDTFEAVYRYSDPDLQLVWSHHSHSPHGFEDRSAGIEFIGTRAAMHGHYGDFKIIPNDRGDEIELPEPTLARSPGHHREWINAIGTRATTSCNFAYGHQLSSVGQLGNIALRTGHTLKWDPQAERITNHDPANNYLLRSEYRAPWSLPDV